MLKAPSLYPDVITCADTCGLWLLLLLSRYQEAVQILLEVIRSVPNLRDPYRTLGALHEVMGQPRQALNFFIIAAHMGKGKQVRQAFRVQG